MSQYADRPRLFVTNTTCYIYTTEITALIKLLIIMIDYYHSYGVRVFLNNHIIYASTKTT